MFSGEKRKRRGLALVVLLAVLGLMLVGLLLPRPSSSASAIPPDDTDYAVINDYWPMERTGSGELIYAHGGASYGEGFADGKEGAIYVQGDLSWGSDLDRRYAQFVNPRYGVWDLVGSFASVVVSLQNDHGPYPSEALEFKIWGSNDFDMLNPEDSSWVVADLEAVYVKGWSDVGESQYAVCNDDYVSVWDWRAGPGTGGTCYRFVKLQSVWASPYDEPEVDAVKGVMPPCGGGAVPVRECGWQSSVLERGRINSYTSLETDLDNRTHIAFGGEQLYYAVLDGSTWQAQLVDKGGVGQYCSLALDASGNAGISYYDAGNGNLKYAHWNGTTWSMQTVDSTGNVGTHTSLAYDSLGRPCISYHDETNADLKYAAWNGLGWDIETVDSQGWVGRYTSLAFDGADSASISYYDATGENLRYAHWNGITWSITVVDTDGDVGSYTSLAFDGTGSPAISYHDETHGSLKYAHWSGTSWQIETVDAEDWVGEHTSLAFDALGQPGISYYDGTEGDLKYALWNGAEWEIGRVDSGGSVGTHTSLDFDGSDRPVISYYDDTNEALKYARWDGTAWQKETVSGVPWVGRFTSLAFDSQGNPGVSYYDLIEGDLKYAHWVGEYWTWEDNTWGIETVDSGGDVGRYTSLTFDALDNACISYYDVTQGNLKYAHWNGRNWEIATVDSGGDVGSYSSLALDGSGNPAMSYYDATNGNLKYAHWIGVGWDITPLDVAGDVGGYSSLAFDDILGYPAVGYYDTTNGDLKYARWNGITWNIETVDSTGDVGSYACLAFDCSGVPAMSYHDATNGDLKYAQWSGTGWIIEVVDSDGWAGSHTSLAFDALNLPAISYHEASEGDLRYAHWNGQQWDIESVDTSDWAGRYTSIDFDRCGQPFISYDGATNGDLKYAYIRNSAPHQPANELPVDGADRIDSATVVLQASLFSDPCVDSQRASQWQITTTAGNYCTPVFDSGPDEINLLRITIAPGVLSEYTTYYWHVRYQDCHGVWSEYSEETSFSTGTPPYQPVNSSPADGAVDVATAPMLMASAFSDPEPSDTHAASQWQITASAGNYEMPVFDETTQRTNLTQMRVSAGVLSTSTTYYWRVRYQDNHGAWSVFSSETSFTTAAVVQNPPYQPVNVSPIDGESDVSLTPTLEAGEFSDGDPDDTHAASQWRITFTAGDYFNPIYDTGSDVTNLTELTIPSRELSPDTAYYWQVRYQDSQGEWSDWSAETGFTTTAAPEPGTEAGIPTGLVILAMVVSIIIVIGIAAPLMLPL